LFGRTTARAEIWSFLVFVTPLRVISLIAVVVANEVLSDSGVSATAASILSSIGCQSGA
jgi:hypothetical protein